MINKTIGAERRKLRTRGKINKDCVRLCVFRSNKYMSAQLIQNGKTIFGCEEKIYITGENKKKTKTERAKIFGIEFAKEALKKKIEKVVFDRGEYLFHGRVKSFADGAREGGLQF